MVPRTIANRIDRRETIATGMRLRTSTMAKVTTAMRTLRMLPVNGGLRVTAHRPARGHGHERQTDRRDDRAGHHRREELHDEREGGCDDEADHRGDQDRTEHRGQTVATREDRRHRGHTGERNALDQRQLGAEEGHAHRLQDRRQTAHEQARSDEHADAVAIEAGGVSDDERNSDDSAVHGQHMLQAVGEGAADRKPFVLGTMRLGFGRRCAAILR